MKLLTRDETPIRNNKYSIIPEKFDIKHCTPSEIGEIRRTNPEKFVLNRQIGCRQVASIMVPLFKEDENKKHTPTLQSNNDIARLMPYRALQNPHLKYA